MHLDKRQYECASSKTLLEPNVYYVVATGYLLKAKTKFNHALKMHFSKRGFSLLDMLPGEKLYCAFCGRANTLWQPVVEIDARKHVTLVGIEYVKPNLYCYAKGRCPGKVFNPNSIEFVSKIKNLSKEDALAYILSRNKSPFYPHNHETPEQYVAYQGTRLTENKTHEEYRAIIDKQNYARSLEGYKERYENGEERWYSVKKQQGITVENLTRKYGDVEEAQKRVDRWKSQVGPSLENFVRRYGDELGLIKFQEFHTKFRNAIPKHGQYSYVSISPKGDILRSNFERKFYDVAEQVGLLNWDYSTDGFYPKSSLRFDFHFPQIELYIELAGMNSPKYHERIQFKIDNFQPLVLYPSDIPKFEKICYNIKERLLETEEGAILQF